MTPDLPPALNAPDAEATTLLNPTEILDAMIELRIQLQVLEEQIEALRPAFFAACLALNTDKIALERATIFRRLTPGQWTYSDNIVEQEDLLKQLKRQFQQTHEPVGGREITWAIKLLLTAA
jgi:hypothetical protein